MEAGTMEPEVVDDQVETKTAETDVDGDADADADAELNAETTAELEHYAEIREVNRELISATRAWELHKIRASGGKKIVDELSQRLSCLIDRGPDPQRKLPFKDDATGDQVAKPDDSWRNASVAEALSLSAKQLEKLEEAGVRTIGQLEDLRGGEGLASIHGFGQATVDKIEEQVLEWLSENRDRFGEVVDQGEDNEEDDGPTEDEEEEKDEEADEDSDESEDEDPLEEL